MKRRSTISFAAAAALVVGLVVAPFAVAPASGASTLTSGTLAGRIYFAAGSSFLNAANKTKLLGIFKTYPEASRIDLIGYSQNRGLDKSSRVLAKARATSINRYLANQGIGDEIVVNVGWQPAASAKLTTARRVNVWVRSLYTVTYNFQNPAASNTSVTFLQASTGLTLPAATRTGFAFLGWYTAATGGSKVVSPFVPTSSTVLYARWGAGYKVSFNANSATGTVPTAIDWDPTTAGVALPTTTTLTKTGFTFDGWSLTAGGAKLTSPYAPTADVTLYARWIVTVTYNANGATSGTAPVAATWAYGSTALTLPGAGTLAKTGYVFGGWSATSTGTAVVDPYTPTASITLYAVWGNTPVITTDSKIINTQASPEIVVYGNAFDTTMTSADLVIDYGTTGIAPCTVYTPATTASSFTLRCSQSAKPGTISIKASRTAFSPEAIADSNVLYITVALNSIYSDSYTVSNAATDPVLDIYSVTSFKLTALVPGDFSTNTVESTTELDCTAAGGATVTRMDSKHVQLKCIGLARVGTLTVSAKSTAFESGSASNVLEFIVPRVVLASTDEILNHQTDPIKLSFTGSSIFKTTTLSLDDLVIIDNAATTGLTCATLGDKQPTGFSLTCTGTPKTGVVSVTARGSAFTTTDSANSTTKTFTIGHPSIAVTATSVNFGAVNPSITVTGRGFDDNGSTGLSNSEVIVTRNGSTGLTSCYLDTTSVTTTTFDVLCTGTVAGGSISIYVMASGYLNGDNANSNTVSVLIPSITLASPVPLKAATNPSITISGNYFRSGVSASDFTINVPGLGLTSYTIVRLSTTSIQINFIGTLTSGTLIITSKSTAYVAPTYTTITDGKPLEIVIAP